MDPEIIRIIGLIFLLVISAFSSAAETAITSVNRIKIRQLSEEGVRSAELLNTLLKHPNRFLSTILLLNNLVNVAAAASMTVLAERYVAYPAAVATGVGTFLILVFGEITPKSFAVQNADRLALLSAPVIRVMEYIFYPLIKLLIAISNLILRLTRARTMKEGPFVTEEEIRTMVSVGEEEGVIEEEEKEMIDSIFEFGETIVKEVMIPRMDMVAVERKTPVPQALDVILHEGYSRLPVFDKTIDNVVGIVYARDLLVNYSKGLKNITLKKLMRQPYFVPETKKVLELLKELQKRKTHMAVVVDEYGGTAGLITIEDILEEIVGEIFDEYDLEEVLVEYLDENNIRVDGKVDLDEINEILGINLPEAEYESIGGFVINLFGKIPAASEEIDYNGLTFKVEAIDGRRISKLLISRKPPEEEKEEKKDKNEDSN
ncbi:MAG: HlyC/CorC family transporter [Actinobacteria bacterium]|nr:MAG: HlyC/CorC family transporter [Actinomycetota bacterium]